MLWWWIRPSLVYPPTCHYHFLCWQVGVDSNDRNPFSFFECANTLAQSKCVPLGHLTAPYTLLLLCSCPELSFPVWGDTPPNWKWSASILSAHSSLIAWFVSLSNWSQPQPHISWKFKPTTFPVLCEDFLMNKILAEKNYTPPGACAWLKVRPHNRTKISPMQRLCREWKSDLVVH